MKVSSMLATASAAAAIVVSPAVALAHGPSSHGHGPASSVRTSAQHQCRDERQTMGNDVFKQTYGTNRNGRNAFGKCVSHRLRQDVVDAAGAVADAPQTCRAQENDPNFATDHNGETFEQFYGTNHNGRNAFGKCVSAIAKTQAGTTESDQTSAEDSAAATCRTEQADPNFAAGHDGKTFTQYYGTNRNGHNAFGKCVSEQAQSQDQQAGSDSGSGSDAGSDSGSGPSDS